MEQFILTVKTDDGDTIGTFGPFGDMVANRWAAELDPYRTSITPLEDEESIIELLGAQPSEIVSDPYDYANDLS